MADVKKVIELEVDVNTGDVKQLNKELKKTGGAIKGAKDESAGLKDRLLTVGDAVKGMAIGVAIAAFAKFKDVLSKNQVVADKLAQATLAVDVAISGVADTVRDEGFLKGFARAYVALMGFTAVAEYKAASAKAEILVQNQKYLGRLEIQARKLQLINQADAETQRQIRDNSDESFEKRIEANNKLAVILEDSIMQEQFVVKARIEILKQEQIDLGFTEERFLSIASLGVELIDINERILGFKSEQQMAERGLFREQQQINEARKKMSEDEAAAADAEMHAIVERLIAQTVREQTRLDERNKAFYDSEVERLRTQDEITVQIMEEGVDKQLAVSAMKYDKLFEQAEGNKDLQLQVIDAQEREAAEIVKKSEDEKKNLREDAAEVGVKLATDGVKAFGDIADAVLGNSEANARKVFQTQKAVSLGMAIIDGFKAVNASLAYAPVVIGAAPNPAGIASLAFAAASSAATIAKIVGTKFQPNGGGGSGGSSASKPNIPTNAPQFNTIGSASNNQLAESIAGQNKNPARAYVVASDVSTAQALDRNKIDTASFG